MTVLANYSWNSSGLNFTNKNTTLSSEIFEGLNSFLYQN